MNAEANNPTADAAGRSVSLRNITRALLIVVPLLGLVGVGVGYTDLNIYQQKFVDVLGCGCEPSFNTNDLTTCVGLTSMGLALTAWWLAASDLPWKARLALTCAEALALFFGFFVTFVRHNLWL